MKKGNNEKSKKKATKKANGEGSVDTFKDGRRATVNFERPELTVNQTIRREAIIDLKAGII